MKKRSYKASSFCIQKLRIKNLDHLQLENAYLHTKLKQINFFF